MPFFLQNSFLAILMLIGRTPVQRRGIGEISRLLRQILANLFLS